MLKLAKYLHTQFWLFVAWLIISAAIILTLLRFALPQLDLQPFALQIERLVEETAGTPLRIGSMQAKMSGPHLALHFNDISLFEQRSGQVLLHFREALADIHLLRSLWEGRLILGQGVLTGGRLDLLRRADGRIVVNRLSTATAEGSKLGLTDLFLRHGQLRLRDSEVIWREETGGRVPLHLQGVNANLLNQAGRHQLAALGGMQENGQVERIRLAADLQQEKGDPHKLSGEFYLKSEGIGMAGRLQGLLPAGHRLERGGMDLELWGTLEAGALTQVEGALKLDDLLLSGAGVEPLKIQRLSANLSWRVVDQGWLLACDRLVLMRDGRLWPPGRLVLLRQSRQDDAVELLAGADYLGIREAASLALLLSPGEDQLRQALAGIRPSGSLSRFRLAMRETAGKAPRWQVSGAVTQFSSLPWRAVPGMNGLDMHFAGNQDGGTLRLESRRFSTEMPRLFREKLDANRLDGRLNWRFSPQQGLWLKTADLRISTDHLQTLSRLRLEVPLQEGRQSFIDMQTDFWEGDGAQKSRYLPVGIMPEPLVDWLDRSLVSGHVKAGSMLLYGPLKSFPYTDLEGRFEVLFGIEDMVLDYRAGWPRLEEGVAEAHFLNNSLQVLLAEGKMLNADLGSAVASIQHLKGASPVEIKADVSGDLNEMLRFLDETPLQLRFGRFTRMARGAGQSHVEVELKVPLKAADRFSIDGRIGLQNASLTLEEPGLQAKGLTGTLSFDEQAVTARALKGSMFGQNLRFEIGADLMDGKPATRITTALRVNRPLLERFMPLSLARPFSGEAEARVRVDISHEQAMVPVRLHAESDLLGMDLELPKPLGKAAGESRQTALELAFRADQKSDLSIDYTGLVRALLQNQGAGFRRGEIRIGQGEPVLPDASRLLVRGDLSRLDLDSWVAWLIRQPDQEGEADISLGFDLVSDEFLLAGVECAKTHFQLEGSSDGWRMTISSPQMEGSVLLPKALETVPITVRLTTLRLRSDRLFPQDTEDTEEGGEAGSTEMDPRRVPGMNLQVERLYLDDNLIGAAQVQWRPAPAGIDLERFSLVGEGLTVNGQGSWHLTGGVQRTTLYLQGKVASLGELQEALKLQLGVSKAPMEFTADLNWPVSPLDLNLPGLGGTLSLQVGAGEVTEVDPGVGRLVGLLSLHALGKRLLLDFSDLFAKGLEFDSIEGGFVFREGNAYTSDLQMEGPSVKVFLDGRIGLQARDYDQTVTVIPRLSSTLPVVGALAVNPAVGVALAVVQQLIGKHVDSVIQTRYTLTGSWESPVIVKLERESQSSPGAQKSDLP